MTAKLYHEHFIDPANVRKYHNHTHCVHVASVCIDICKKLNFKDIYSYIEIAALWHDVVYIPGRTDNEELSAQALLALHPHLRFSADLIRNTTITHHLSETITWENLPSVCVLLDADLDSLAFSWKRFVEVQCAILAESNQTDLSKSARFLKQFLNKQRIYRCPESEAKEFIARANITKFVELVGK